MQSFEQEYPKVKLSSEKMDSQSKAIFHFLICSGYRISEINDMKVKDVNQK